MGSLKQKEVEADPEQVEPEAWVEVVVSDPAGTAASAEDLAKD